MPKYIDTAKVISVIKLNNNYFILNLQVNNNVNEIKPGQFLELAVPNTSEVFLRRPFSIHDVDEKNNVIKLLIQVVGKGTRSLLNLRPNDNVNIIYPLGNGFKIEHLKHNALLIGGGCGVAPLLLLAKHLHKKNIKIDILIGVKTTDDLIEIEEYKKYGNIYITTEDGTIGTKGYVIHHEIMQKLSKYELIFTCGPEVMMKAVAKRANENNIPCQVSLENTMACGIGVCLCCVTPTIYGNLCVCTEGPIFNSKDLLW